MLKLTYRIGSDFMHYADIKEYDIANGPGVRVSLFVSGCTHKCKGCFNAEAWDFCYGNLFTEKEEEKILESLGRDYISGITFLGGEPFEHENQKGILPLIRKIKERYPDKSIWCFSGYTFDKDIVGDMCKKWDETKELISYIDVLVDGKFEIDKKDIKLKFRGSSNQRIINVKESLKKRKVIICDEYMN